MVKRRSSRYYRVIGAIGTNRLVTRLHPVVYRASGGRLFGRVLGITTVVLEATGARSGLPRPVPVFAMEDGEALIVIASNGGKPDGPAWAANLRAHPTLAIRHRRRVRTMRARELEGAERARAWAIATAAYPGYDDYAARIPHKIPVFAMEPV
ncbi:MAG TPA: nitroreductase/quinone reductase family protein [Candidatus Limnocylindrales bacterium]|jgi:deazaflavin-dependent oxidoreductase (nitroreductase family)